MKQNIRTLIVSALVMLTQTASYAQGYRIDVKINGVKDTTLLLGYYFNKQMFVKDTADVDSNGHGAFEGKEPLDEGIYVIYLPDKSYFDILINDDQDFSVSATDGDLVKSQKITGNKEAGNFLKYQQYLNLKQKEAGKIQKGLKDLKKGEPEYEKSIEKLKAIKEEVDKEMNRVIDENTGTLLARFLLMTKDIEIPDFDVPENVANKDSVIQIKKYQYYKKHYFDNVDFNDERLLRTPVFTNKLERYFNNVVIQVPDSLIKEADLVIAKTEDPKMRRYLIQYLFNMANESKIMGMDKMVVAMAENYYLSGQADWADSTFLTKLQERVTKIKPNLIGNQAPDLLMQSVDGQFYRLSEVRAPITILIFWEPNCGHCKKEVPKLKEEVWDKYRDKGVKIFAVYTQTEKGPWEKFIEEHDLFEWINVYDPYYRSNFRNLYDIYSTPTIYVLDRNKKIIGKRIGVEQLPGFIDYELKQQEKK
jgi:peroxiredoxin